ncbi:uncharacterized protein [Prorops nasuta]|uniref:uncharacterized protein n=1 Tax=Prorops nasuta TaxID=863751 RepID=UPI0034CF2064
MEKLAQIREQLLEYKAASRNEKIRADCFLADLELESLQIFLRHKLNHREIHLQVVRSRNSSSIPVLQEIQLPQLFVNGIPIRRLFLRNIAYRINKTIIHKCLCDQGCSAFEVISVKTMKSGSVATLNCSSIASVCEIQCKSCKKELTYTDPKGKISFIKVRPDQFITQDPLLPSQSNKQRANILPRHITLFLNNSEPVFNLLKYQGSNDFFSFYSACGDDCRFHHLVVPFDASCDRYSGSNGLNLLLRDAQNFSFNSIVFGPSSKTFETPFVNKFLLHCVKRASIKLSKIGLRLVDLSGIESSEQTIKIISKSFTVRKLILGNTTGKCDELLEIQNLYSLILLNNNHLSLNFLKKECFAAHLVSLEINCSNELPIDILSDFIASNQRLRELIFVNSQSKFSHTAELAVAAFSGNNVLEVFNFRYSELKIFRTQVSDLQTFNVSDKLKELNLENNDFFVEHIQELLPKLPNLHNINILGLDLNRLSNLVLKFSNFKYISTIKINYFYNINTTLRSLVTTIIKEITVINKLGKRKTRPIDPLRTQASYMAMNVQSRQVDKTLTLYKGNRL